MKIEEHREVELVTTEVQTEYNDFDESRRTQALATKVYKEINIQTDDVKIGPASVAEEEIVDELGDQKSTTTTERRAKQLNTFSANLQHNMNELLSE